ncbi:MAG: Asp-tRNA(Asn)/Glu-tRNA(Gln) amidotransferase subunit GatC [Candidatus Jorgensenbacteria bacterium]
MLSEKDVTHLAELARMALTPSERKSLLKDLEKMLAHFEELKEVNTDGVTPMTGGTQEVNAVRKDETGMKLPADATRAAFPESEKGFLKIPPVFGE